MSTVRQFTDELFKKLPKCKGDLIPNAPLSIHTRFKTGGNAEVLFMPYDVDDLKKFIKEIPADVPITILGLGSNVLIRDGGVRGVVILPFRFCNIDVDKENKIIKCGAFANSLLVSHIALKNEISGLEFLCCVPGTVAGGAVMNAGSYGDDYSKILISIKTINRFGKEKIYTKEECNLQYRSSSIPKDEVIVEVSLQGNTSKSSEQIKEDMEKMISNKNSTQPITARCAGSSFKNPPEQPAWKCIRDANAETLTQGDAKLSDIHSNFIINDGNASATDIEDLGEKIRTKVYETSGIMLHWEIKILGDR